MGEAGPSPIRADAGLRALRAAVFSVMAVALSAAAHALASGSAISGWALAAGLVVTTVSVAPLASRECSVPGLAAVLLCAQTGLHVLFCLGGHAPGRPVPAVNASMPGMQAGMRPGMSMGVLPGPRMFLAHLAAALLVGWVLRRGDAVLWRIIRPAVGFAAAWLRRLASAARSPARGLDRRPGLDAHTEYRQRRPVLAAFLYVVVRRGPPGTAEVI